MNNSTSARSTPLTRRWRIVSSRSVRERDEESRLCTDIRTARFLARAREKALDGDTVRSDTPLVAVEWEDITAYSRTAIPEDFEPYRHNDFHIIPRGVIRKLTYLTDAGSLVSLQLESA